MTAEPLVDLAAWRELQDTAGADFAAELVGTFLEEAPALLKELTQAHADGDADGFRRAAHTLKSNGLTFGARPLAQLARELELAPLAAADGAALAAVQATYLATASALQALADGTGPGHD